MNQESSRLPTKALIFVVWLKLYSAPANLYLLILSILFSGLKVFNTTFIGVCLIYLDHIF